MIFEIQPFGILAQHASKQTNIRRANQPRAESSAFQLHHQLFPLGGERGQLRAQFLGQRGQPLRSRRR